jgi:hypothetical protein
MLPLGGGEEGQYSNSNNQNIGRSSELPRAHVPKAHLSIGLLLLIIIEIHQG